MSKITNFLSENPTWVNIVKAARCRGFLRCSGNSGMKFVPVLPYEPRSDLGEDCIQSIIEEEFYIQIQIDEYPDWCSEILGDLSLLKAAKNALIILEDLEESAEDGEDRYFYYQEVVPLPTAVAA